MLILPVSGLALIGYFGYHLVEGDRGLLAWRQITQQLSAAQQDLSSVEAERTALERRVSHLRSDHVDPDLLDTQIRKTLNLVAPDEIVITPPPGRH